MSQPNNLRRCHTTLDQDSSLIAAVEMSSSSWLSTHNRKILQGLIGPFHPSFRVSEYLNLCLFVRFKPVVRCPPPLPRHKSR